MRRCRCRRRRRNQVRCYVFISPTNIPVRGAIVSCTFCDRRRIIYRRTDIFGTAVFNLPDGEYLFRCECVPSFLSPSQEDFCITLNCCRCEADLLFPATFLGTNAINQLPLTNTELIQSNQQSIFNNVSGLINNTSPPNPTVTNTYIPPVNTQNSGSSIGSPAVIDNTALQSDATTITAQPNNPTPVETQNQQGNQATMQTMAKVRQYGSSTSGVSRLNKSSQNQTYAKPVEHYINPQPRTYKG